MLVYMTSDNIQEASMGFKELVYLLGVLRRLWLAPDVQDIYIYPFIFFFLATSHQASDP